MGFNNFRLNVLLRALAFAVLCFALFWSLASTTWLATPLLCGLLLLLSVTELIRYMEYTVRRFASFLDFVAHHDFSTPPSVAYQGPDFDDLQRAYEVVAAELRRLNRQRAANHQYLEAVVEHVEVALCCFDEVGQVRMLNEPARKLFGVPHPISVRSFERMDARLPDILRNLGGGERTMLRLARGNDTLQLVLYATTFDLLEQHYKLVSFQNIRDELDRQEIDSWQKLIRVLTHEIMNSVTPITSLSRYVREALIDESGTAPVLRTLSAVEQNDLLRAISAIQARSSGLLDFVQAYQSFSRLPRPEFAQVEVGSLLERVRMLMSTEIDAHHIVLDLICAQPGLSIHVDPRQTEQVLLNLLRNAVEALTETAAPRIELTAGRDEQGRVLVQVIDNGPGIPPEHLDSIFVPFFTTKRNGSGVGLSICRQLMHANRGFIGVRSAPGEGCVFTLRFS